MSYHVWGQRPISDRHSINRVKRSQAIAERYRGTRRAARHWIACKWWLGTWGRRRKRPISRNM